MSDSGRFIVVFKESATQEQIDKAACDINAHGGEVRQRFDSVLKGFAATIPASFFAEFQSLQADIIDHIEPDGIVTTQESTQ